MNSSCINTESDLVYVDSQLSISQTISKCLDNVVDPSIIPVIRNGEIIDTLRVAVSLQLNNIISIDEINKKTLLDFEVILKWEDDRFNMPLFWNKTSNFIQSNGIELTDLLSSNDIWKPELKFLNLLEITAESQVFKLNGSNIFQLNKKICALFSQPRLSFSKFPNEEQNIILSFRSLKHTQNLLKFDFSQIDSPLTLSEDFKNSSSVDSSKWDFSFSDSQYHTYSSDNFDNVNYQLSVNRIEEGPYIRLFNPILIFSIILGLTFFVPVKQRIMIVFLLFLTFVVFYGSVINHVNFPSIGDLTVGDEYLLYIFIEFLLVIFMHLLHYQIYFIIERLQHQHILKLEKLRSLNTAKARSQLERDKKLDKILDTTKNDVRNSLSRISLFKTIRNSVETFGRLVLIPFGLIFTAVYLTPTESQAFLLTLAVGLPLWLLLASYEIWNLSFQEDDTVHKNEKYSKHYYSHNYSRDFNTLERETEVVLHGETKEARVKVIHMDDTHGDVMKGKDDNYRKFHNYIMTRLEES